MVRVFPHLHYTGSYYVSLLIQSKCGKLRTSKTTNTGTFYAVRTPLQFYLHIYMTMLLILLNLAPLYGHH